jgi:hypothetical protein
MRQKRIQYAIDLDTGMVWSQVGNELAIPILDFAGMKPENNWEMKYNLGKFQSASISGAELVHTRKIPVKIKNAHRAFWGMKPLKEMEEL